MSQSGAIPWGNRDEADRFVARADRDDSALEVAHAIIAAAVLAVDVARFGILLVVATILAIVL